MTDTCGGTKRDGSGDACSLPAGWGTDHVGEGKCKLHGGANATGEDNGAFKHGLFSDYLDEEDREAVDALDEYGDVAKLDELINWRLARLRRAVRALNDSERSSFWDAFEDLVAQTGPIESAELRELAKMLGQHDRAMQNEIDLVRKLIKDRNKIAEGDDVNVSLRELFGGDG